MRYSVLLTIGLSACAVLWPPRALGAELYLLAASAVPGPVTYPADLYTVGQDGHLQLVRNISPASDGVAFVLAAPDVLAVAHPQLMPRTLDLIHFESPASADAVRLPNSERQVLGGFVVQGGGRTLAALKMSAPFGEASPQPMLIGIDLDRSADPKRRLLSTLAPADLAGEQDQGAPGGQFFYYPPLLRAKLTKDGWVDNRSEGTAVLAPTSVNRPLPVQSGRTLPVVCANAEFLVLSLDDLKTHSEALSRAKADVLVVNRQSGDWRAVTIPGSQSRLRIFGSWLAALVVESARGRTVIAGAERQRREATNTRPSVAGEYDSALKVKGEWLPGELLLINLDTGTSIPIHTGQADSEVLSVSGDSVLYRVNQQILKAPLSGRGVGKSLVLADDENIPEVHWAFWSTS